MCFNKPCQAPPPRLRALGEEGAPTAVGQGGHRGHQDTPTQSQPHGSSSSSSLVPKQPCCALAAGSSLNLQQPWGKPRGSQLITMDHC